MKLDEVTNFNGRLFVRPERKGSLSERQIDAVCRGIDKMAEKF